MSKLNTPSQNLRRSRVHQFIQLGGLLQKAGLLETFEIPLGADLQKDLELKRPVAALFNALLELNELARSEDFHMQLYAERGLIELRKSRRQNYINI